MATGWRKACVGLEKRLEGAVEGYDASAMQGQAKAHLSTPSYGSGGSPEVQLLTAVALLLRHDCGGASWG